MRRCIQGVHEIAPFLHFSLANVKFSLGKNLIVRRLFNIKNKVKRL